MHTQRTILHRLLPFSLMAASAGCSVTLLEPSSEDTVRERVAAVEERNRELELENEGLRGRVAELEGGFDRDELAAAAATPRLSEVLVSNSSVVEPGPEGAAVLVLRLDPSDDRGRFMQVVGSLVVRVVAVPETGGPRSLAVRRFDPSEVREGWRGGVFGSGYVFEIPLGDASPSELPGTVDVVASFTDLTTGRDFRDERPVRVVGGGV